MLHTDTYQAHQEKPEHDPIADDLNKTINMLRHEIQQEKG